jgi:hypothetical protein
MEFIYSQLDKKISKKRNLDNSITYTHKKRIDKINVCFNQFYKNK